MFGRRRERLIERGVRAAAVEEITEICLDQAVWILLKSQVGEIVVEIVEAGSERVFPDHVREVVDELLLKNTTALGIRYRAWLKIGADRRQRTIGEIHKCWQRRQLSGWIRRYEDRGVKKRSRIDLVHRIRTESVIL